MEFHCLIVDSDQEARKRLLQAMKQIDGFSSDLMVDSTQDAVQKIELGKPFDVFFISESFPEEDLKSFIEKAKSLEKSQDAAFILVQRTTDDEIEARENAILLGGDGVLCAPFSVDKLQKVTELAAEVRKNRWAVREQIRMKKAMPEIMAKLDLAATVKSEGFKGEVTGDAFRKACGELSGDELESIAIFLGVALDEFEHAEVPEGLDKVDQYKGISHRVRDRIEKKVVKKLEKNLAEESEQESPSEEE